MSENVTTIEPEVAENPITQQPQIWSIAQITIASYIAGPIAGTYLLGKNYKELGFQDTANKCYASGIIGTILLLLTIFLIPDELMDRIPKFIIPLSYTSLIIFFAEYQKKLMVALSDGIKKYSFSRCFLLSLAFLVVQVPLFILLAFIAITIMD